MRLSTKIEMAAIFSFWPICTIAAGIGAYRLLIWSYGGSDCFRYMVVQEPFKEEWFTNNPRAALGRSMPLQDTPKYLETPGHPANWLSSGEEHPHSRNF